MCYILHGTMGLIYKACVRSDLIVECACKSTPALIFVNIIFDVEKCLASHQGLSRRTQVESELVLVTYS